MNDYRPIDCGLYSEYELAIIRRRPLHLVWAEGNVIFDRIVLPRDLETRDGAEYLHAEYETGELLTIRLDRIRSMQAS